MKKIFTAIAMLFVLLSTSGITFAYSDDYLNDYPKPSRRDMHYYYANNGRVPTPQIKARGHFIIIQSRNTYAPSVSKLKNKRHYHRVVTNNYYNY